MRRKGLVFYTLFQFLAVLVSGASVNTQVVSTTSGFYSVDSLFFTVNQAPPQGGKIEISVNCFNTGSCFSNYKTGVWLYNRNNAPNTWEDQQFSRAPIGGNFDTLAHRGPLDKVNVVRVRIKNAKGDILSDVAYFIGILGKGKHYPYTLPVVQLLVDSMDAFGPYGFYGPGLGIRNQYVNVWNYEIDQSPVYSLYVPRDRVEKQCIMQVTDTGNHVILYQKCGIHTTGQHSRSAPNKSMEVVARTEYSGSNTFKTGLLGDKKGAYQSIRFRSGGAGQLWGFGANEIAESIIDGLGVGGVPVRPVIVFLNGSYWSLTFAQADIEDYATQHAIHPEKVSFIKPVFSLKTPQFDELLKNRQFDTKSIAWIPINGSDQIIATGLLEQGDKDLFQSVSGRLANSVTGQGMPLSYSAIDSLVDVNAWLTYIAVADFGRIMNSIQHHVFIGTAPGKKMFLLMDEAKDFAMQDPAGNHWNEHILPHDSSAGNKTFENVLIQDILLKNNECVEKLCRRYQDLLNTSFKPQRTTAIVEKLTKEVLPEYGKYWRSWYPNSGLDSTGETTLLESIKDFCQKRPDIAWQQLADQWRPEANLHLSERRNVNVVLDSVPEGAVQVHINSLVITKNWSGLYYRDPPLEVSMDALKVPPGYELVWKEHPDLQGLFKISTLTEITLTPVLRRIIK